MNVLSLLVVCVCLTQTPAEAVFRVNPINETQPSGPRLNPFTGLACEIEADFTVTPTAVETRWIVPNGTIVRGNDESDKYTLTQGPGSNGFQTVLLIQNLIYSDASDSYMCGVRDTRDPDNRGPWFSYRVTLRLLVELTADERDVTTFDNATDVSLSCEMSLYLRPDEDLQWFRGEQLITASNDRYTVSYTNGTDGMGQFGGDTIGPSRVSTLIISEPHSSDSDTYTCAIRDTEHSQDIQLTVQSAGVTNPSTVQPSKTSSNQVTVQTSSSTGDRTSTMGDRTSASNTNTMSPVTKGTTIQLPIIIGAIAGVLGIIVIVLIVIIIIVSFRRRSHTATIRGNGDTYAALNGGSSANKLSVSPPPHDLPRGESEMEMGGCIPTKQKKKTNSRSPPPNTPAPDYEYLDTTGGKYDPYYDNPEDIKQQQAPAVPTHPPPSKSKKDSGYDEVGKTSTLDMRSVPSPAVVLSGSLNRQIEQRNPDFAYPTYQDGFELSGEPDYDQIYSEPLDPTMLRSNVMENVLTPEEAVPYSAIYDDPANPFPDEDLPAPFTVARSNIIEIRKLGTGQFGQVILAKTKGISLRDMGLSETDSDSSRSILVAIKKLKQDAESGLMKAFQKEIKFMSRLKHDNVVRLLAVCTGAESFIMMEYMENGDLNQFLQKQALMSDSISGLQENQVTPIILLYIGVQIASGMHYLASRRFVHRDLATRNCLVGKDFIVKISDFGMSRSLYESAYYRVQGTLVLPIRWMACETFYGKFSVKSDSWAFGVTLWELYTLGKVDPYEHLTDEEVIADAIRGPDRKTLPRPSTCPHEVYEIMQRCWVNEPSMRADFGEIYSRLFMIYTRQAL